MVFKCNYCGSRAKFDIEKQLLRCESCDRLLLDVQVDETEFYFDRYHCSSCGAGLNVNEGEMTSNCPYCGAQSIIYEGKDEEFPVEYIVPFKISANNAVALIKEEFAQYKYAPKAIRKFDIEEVRPVYIPYWLTDLHIETYQECGEAFYTGIERMLYLNKRSLNADFINVPQDGSFRLRDSFAKYLEPWDEKEKIVFEPKYLAGLYANTLDLSRDKAEDKVLERAKVYVDDIILNSFNLENSIKEIRKKYRHNIEGQKLVLMPIWFFSSSYQGKRYSAVINGQTGKIISAVPHSRTAMATIIIKYTAVSFVPVMLYLFITYLCFGDKIDAIVGWVLISGAASFLMKLYKKSIQSYNSYKKILAETRAESLISFSKEQK